MPSRESAQADYVEAFPEDAPFIAGAEYGHGPVNLPGLGPVVADLDSQLEQLASADVDEILESFQTNADAALKASQTAPAGAAGQAGGGIQASRAGWLFVTPTLVILGPVPRGAGADGALGVVHRLERARQPVLVGRRRSSAPTTTRSSWARRAG